MFDVVDFRKTCTDNTYPSGLACIPVYYVKCSRCGFIFTDFFDDFDPAHWSAHIYNDEYRATVDPSYLDVRPAGNARSVDGMLRHRKATAIGLDYGGGSGQTCALLRKLGYKYDTCDPFGETWLTPELAGRYNFCSVFEVAEHTPDPLGLFEAIVSLTSKQKLAVLMGTQLHDTAVQQGTRLSWWYAAPRNGHISLYSRASMQFLADKFGLTYTPLTAKTHLFTREYTRREAYLFLLKGKISSKLAALAH